jgi:beta-glucosidase
MDPAAPIYPFGYGLSYTSFSYADLEISPSTIPQGGTARVSVEVTNTGDMAGDEVVQLYIRDEVASVYRPIKQLKGFSRIHLEPGESQSVTFEVGFDELCFYGLDEEWITEPGDFTIMIGRNSRDIELQARLTLK